MTEPGIGDGVEGREVLVKEQVMRIGAAVWVGVLVVGSIAVAAGDRYGDELPAGASARLGTLRYRMTGWESMTALQFYDADRRLRSGRVGWEVETGKLVAALPLPTSPYYEPLVVLSGSGGMALMREFRKEPTPGVNEPTVLIVRDAMNGRVVKELEQSALEGTPGGARFSNDGTLVAVIDVDARVGHFESGRPYGLLVWEVQSGKKVFQKKNPVTGRYPAIGMDFSPNGKLIGMAGNDGVMRVYDIAGGEEARTVETGAGRLLSPRFIDDGTLCAGGENGLIVWKVEEEKAAVWKFPEHLQKSYAHQLAVSADRKFVAAATSAGPMIFDVTSGKMLESSEPGLQAGETLSVTFSKDGKMLAVGRGQCAEILEVDRWKAKFPVKAHGATVLSVAVSSDGKTIVTGDARGEARLWNDKGEAIRKLQGVGKAIACVAIAPDGKTAAGAAGLWDLTTGEIERGFEGNAGVLVRYVDDGKQLIEVTKDSVRWREAASGDVKHEVKTAAGKIIVHAAMSADGSTLAWSEVNENETYKRSGINPADAAVYTGRVWDVAERKEIATFRVSMHGLALSPDGKRLAFGEEVDYSERPAKTHVSICDALTGKVTQRIGIETGYPSLLEWSPDGKWLAAEYRDNVIRVLETVQFKEVAQLRGHTHYVQGLCWSGNSAKLVSVGWDTTGLVWDVAGVLAKRERK